MNLFSFKLGYVQPIYLACLVSDLRVLLICLGIKFHLLTMTVAQGVEIRELLLHLLLKFSRQQGDVLLVILWHFAGLCFIEV